MNLYDSPGKKYLHCYGCGTGHSIFGYVATSFNISCTEAMEILACAYDIKLNPRFGTSITKHQLAEQITEIHNSSFYKELKLANQRKSTLANLGLELKQNIADTLICSVEGREILSKLPFLRYRDYRTLVRGGGAERRRLVVSSYNRNRNRTMILQDGNPLPLLFTSQVDDETWENLVKFIGSIDKGKLNIQEDSVKPYYKTRKRK